MAIIRKPHSMYTPALHKIHYELWRKGITTDVNWDTTKTGDPRLDFMNPGSITYLDSCLQSVGGVPYTKLHTAEVFKTNRETQMCIGDSGGFQIRTGALKFFDWSDPYSTKNDKVRLDFLRWGEEHCDINLLLDIPPIGNFLTKMFGKYIFEESLKLTKFNFEYNIKHRTNPDTRWLNVVQATTIEEGKHWFDEVKQYIPYTHGWGFGTYSLKSLRVGLPLLRYMIENHAFDKQNDWIHVLGISPVRSTFAYNAIQKTLRKLLGLDIQVTYDSSSPLSIAQYGLFSPSFTITKSRTVLEMAKYFKNEDFDPEMQVPFLDIPIKFKDILQVDGTKHGPNDYGYFYGMATSVVNFMKATDYVNKITQLPRSYMVKLIERQWAELADIIEEYLTCDKPDLLFEKHKIFLDKIVLDTPENDPVLKNQLFVNK